MLLTLPKTAKSEFETKTHAYSPIFPSASSARYSPQLKGGPFSSVPAGAPTTMAAPLRGLPHPLTSLPAPTQPTHQQGSSGPPPPSTPHWQTSQTPNVESNTKDWFLAKAEEDRRKQEEEKTRQGELKLEQRKIERSMLQESLQGGVPPHLVPLIFAGIGGGNVSNWTMDLIQQYAAQLQVTQQQQQGQQHAPPTAQSPTASRRHIEPGTYVLSSAPQQAAPPPPSSVLPTQPLQGQPHHGVFSSAYPGGSVPLPGHAVAPMPAPPPPPSSQLPKLATNEMSIQPPPTAPSSVQQTQSAQPAQQEESSLYFYHWVPPSSQQEKSSSGNAPATPSGKYKASASFPPRARAATDASDANYASSPKKRKAEGGHPAPPVPTSAPQTHTSPSYSQVSSSSTSTPQRGHARGHSDASTRGDTLRATLNRPNQGYGQEYTERSGTRTNVPEQRHYRASHDEGYHYGRRPPPNEPSLVNEPSRYETQGDWHQHQQPHHQRPALPHSHEGAPLSKREEGRQ
ncbi:uncharacterized protein EI97DRAFT_453203 [Westerdykella ornata]|uniref:Uncharacterized protein n=1 Tax=Westerdykella ornata TaxID=318751 RepID=A0A6A6J7J7_WESOR|nr:uncharacterized protein EI97DRAFT_453203 [Westerdykella ornata]KAF2272177.1 hypothetical protein EI97DRAFT_453203 [Westerdykella ornata]